MTKTKTPKTPKTPRAKKVKKEIAEVYQASIKVLGRTYKATGTTCSEAISNLKPGNCKGKGILTIEKGDFKKERVLMPMLVWRLFNSRGITQEVALKNASNLFGV